MAVTFREWIHVSGRGWIAIIDSNDPSTDIQLFMPGRRVHIQGERYLCTGVEVQQSLMSPPRPLSPFGVLIRGEPVGRS